MTDQHSAGGHTDLVPLREFLKFRYSATSESCKCGNCQLVPAADLARFATEDETLRRNLRHWREECGKLHARVSELEEAMKGATVVANAAGARIAELEKAFRDILDLPAAILAFEYLDRGIGAATQEGAWLRARAALASSRERG